MGGSRGLLELSLASHPARGAEHGAAQKRESQKDRLYSLYKSQTHLCLGQCLCQPSSPQSDVGLRGQLAMVTASVRHIHSTSPRAQARVLSFSRLSNGETCPLQIFRPCRRCPHWAAAWGLGGSPGSCHGSSCVPPHPCCANKLPTAWSPLPRSPELVLIAGAHRWVTEALLLLAAVCGASLPPRPTDSIA